MRPRVFLANLGPVAAFAARAAFAVNFFEAGGFETFGNDDEATPAELVEAGLQWLAPLDNANRIVCLCSSDQVYEREAVVIANAFREAGVRRISLAGNPGSLKVDLRAAGIDMFIFAGSDALTVYARLYAAEA
jgi:methylmalonyl-CoA mutase